MTGNTPPNPEAAVPYASAEQLGELYTKMNEWLVENGTYKVDGGMASYGFVADGEVVARLLPEVPQVFPDVEFFELGYVPGNNETRADADACDFQIKMREGSLYDYWDIDVSVSGVTDDGKLLAEPYRNVELAVSFPFSPLESPAEIIAEAATTLRDAIFATGDKRDMGAHEIDMRELGALTNLVDNLDLIKQTQEG